ncbi:hypothetical protein CO173_04825 [Candidatus Uhrbacteria bacterium CG_4_9_14_3_um_filter_41_35]|uniref:PEGA domain-containing protein n=1 Tax=Candidatus Uhrbacteria bacterium CG_4_9_14_3_um_filter_41_35 TaxID=1975034 RepID=A0A2M7XDE3_9BACT|nr:MAG: hypothetical protein COV92_01915 [Candidatus Uhrbacteria bacterium CG11_big_fil_rev_8_21_14_0_20_41_9]PJA45746.1 MAG: hypothetical protein CO173_04825 [Candidatus Uhrbacteria bacterium CG_4_9_14_3_um_filter_41_35]
MNKTSRNILFIVFVTFFFVGAPIIVLYTAGIRYDVKSGEVLKTGVISVTTTPRSANLLVNGAEINHETPYVIKNLNPGTYTVEIQKPDYHPWKSTVSVKASETSFIQNIILFRDEPPKLRLSKLDTNISRSPNNDIIAYFKSNTEPYDLVVWDVVNNRLIKSFVVKDILDPSDYSINWSIEGKNILLKSKTTADFKVFSLADSVVDFTKLQSPEITQVFWHPSTENILYISSNTEMAQINLETGDTETFTGESKNSVLVDASLLSFFNNGAQIELRQTIGTETSLVALLPISEYTILARHGAYLMLSDNRKELFLVNIHDKQPLLLESKAILFDWLDSEELLAYSDGNEINVYDPKTHSNVFITRQAEQITAVKWHGTGNTILATTKNSITAIETFKAGEDRMITPLLSNVNIENFWVSNDNKLAYYFTGSDLYSLQLTK